jgi:DNA-binding NarL/FixJ family response regulator
MWLTNPNIPRVQVAMPTPQRFQVMTWLEAGGYTACGNEPTEAECRQKIQAFCPDVILLTICLRQESGWRTMTTIRAIHPAVKIILLAEIVNPIGLARAITYGAVAYLPNTISQKQLLATVETVIDGVQLFDPHILQATMAGVATGVLAGKQQDVSTELTEAEERVLRLLVSGLDNAGIAQHLNVTINTIKTHMRHVFHKIQVKDRTQAAVWAVRQGLG